MDFKKEVARVAYTLIKDNSSVGLGDGTTARYLASYVINGIGAGLTLKVYTSSLQTQDFLETAGIPVSDISSVATLDQYFDGCDQIDHQLNALKSGSGIHTMEKILASMAKKFIIMADATKYVAKLESKTPLVLEILPLAISFVHKELQTFYPEALLSLRKSPENKTDPVLTRNGNYLMDCLFPEWPEPGIIQNQCKNITGVVEISLFYDLVDEAIIVGDQGILRYERKNN